jgi:hypothetical protein
MMARGDPYRQFLPTSSPCLDPAGGERHNDYWKNDCGLRNIARHRNCDCSERGDDRDEHSQLEYGVPALSVGIHTSFILLDGLNLSSIHGSSSSCHRTAVFDIKPRGSAVIRDEQ